MRLPSQFHARSPIRFNITPLIDVVFLLIIFFLAASHFARSEAAVEINLPDSERGRREDESAKYRLTVTIQRDGTLNIGSQTVETPMVTAALQQLVTDANADGEEPEVRIRVDQDAPYGHARLVIQSCAELGIRHLRFAVTGEVSTQ
ncbi:MAG: biopolymer transporter ExbD [Planctomycetaceae bacterium]|nr:biopolymer transporter ExbD [Planctomycetaceae bacterium]